MFLQKTNMRNFEKKRYPLMAVIPHKSLEWKKVVFFLMTFAGSITLLANTCKECDTTFWPKEGENGRICQKCLGQRWMKNLMEEQKRRKKENEERERRQIENDDALFEMNSRRFIGWIFYSEGSNIKYQIMLRNEQNPRERVLGKYGLLSLYEKRMQGITNSWFKANPAEPVFFSRVEHNRFRIIISDGKKQYQIKNIKPVYDGVSYVSVRIVPFNGGIKVSASPGQFHEHGKHGFFWKASIKTCEEPGRSYVVDVSK